MEAAKVVYLDSTIFITAATNTGKEGERARKFILNSAGLFTSELSFVEALRGITKKMGKEQACWTCERFFKLPKLSILPGDFEVTKRTIENYKTTNLEPRLAMHLAYMQINEINQIASLDPAFDKVKGIKRVKL